MEFYLVLEFYLDNYLLYNPLHYYHFCLIKYLFYHKYFNLIDKLSNIDDSKILYYYIDPNELTPKDIIDALNGKHFNEDNRFYENKTIYRIGDIND